MPSSVRDFDPDALAVVAGAFSVALLDYLIAKKVLSKADALSILEATKNDIDSRTRGLLSERASIAVATLMEAFT
jgi:hypothetical protein